MQDFHIEGIGKINGGEFGNITVEGVGNCYGDLKADIVRIEGVFSCKGGFDVNLLDCEGVADFFSDIRAKKIVVEGVLNAKKEVKIEAEEIICEGVIKAGGEVSADVVHAEGCITADEIFGDKIFIDSYHHPRFVSRILRRWRSEVRLIEATTIDLRGVSASSVNGKDITIGPDCRIENIDCNGTLYIDKSSYVRNITGEYTMK